MTKLGKLGNGDEGRVWSRTMVAKGWVVMYSVMDSSQTAYGSDNVCSFLLAQLVEPHNGMVYLIGKRTAPPITMRALHQRFGKGAAASDYRGQTSVGVERLRT